MAGRVDEGLGFTIDAKVSVNGSPQYKGHNSKGTIYYVTANKAFLFIRYIVTNSFKLAYTSNIN